MAALPFLEARLSDAIARRSRGGPTMPGRTKAYAPGGRLTQNFITGTRLHKFDLSYGIKRKADFEEVLSAFHVVMGTPYAGLRHKDWNDYRATSTNSTLTLISGTTWQLQRKYVFGGITCKRDVQKPVSGSVAVYTAGGVLLSSSIDTTTGIATIASGTPAYWTGFFDVPVTFVDNSIENIEIDGYMGPNNELLGLPSVKLEEIML